MSVYIQSRRSEGRQPNGIIYAVDYQDEKVWIKFHGVKFPKKGWLRGGDQTELDFDDIQHKWTDQFGGLYFVDGL